MHSRKKVPIPKKLGEKEEVRNLFFLTLNLNKLEALKVDITKCKTVENYAKDYNLSRTTVYKRIKQGDLKTITIDGVNFIRV